MSAEEANHRVTNAILLTKLDSLASVVQQQRDEAKTQHEEIKSQFLSLATDVTALKVCTAGHAIRIGRNEGELEGLKRKGVLWDAINSIGAIGAFLLGKIT